MKKYNTFKELYSNIDSLPETGWIYIKESDYQNLEIASYYVLEECEITSDEYIEMDEDIVPIILYEIDNTITGLVENHIFKAIYENMGLKKKEFSLHEKIKALRYYVEEDTFLH